MADSKEKFYITTPIYYVNDKPHIGHLYTTIVADVLARYHRLRGKDVFFLTGTDENSQKNVEAATEHGYDDIKRYLDTMSDNWRTTFADLGMTFDDFIRTTETRHRKGVEKFWRTVKEKGDIYLGEYEGLYCTGCETFLNESDLVEGKCADHKKKPERIKEKNFFFRLSRYREALLKHIDENPGFIRPKSRRNEVRSYVDKFMEDISISRESMEWGIPVPDEDGDHVIYVWFDALLNYMTGVGYGTDDEKFRRYWPADLHLVGKDIIKFHCALWPAMLMSAGIPLPKQIFAHGFFTIDGDKMSKSLGNAIDPKILAEEYGIDVVRYFLLREITFGEDGDFSVERLRQRYTSELANDLGNLLHRTLSMADRYFGSKVPAQTEGDLAPRWQRYEDGMENLDFAAALDAIWGILRDSNRYIDDTKPWELAKSDTEKLEKVIYTLLERLRHVAWMLAPITPEVAQNICVQLGRPDEFKEVPYDDAKTWGGMRENATIAKGEPLFPRLDT